ncbi:MAG: SDR family NAD(P)-dependent oxidoreductase [Pseudomonadota bacterium]|nr:SDR family NAD(P)-dependent oxidoreductase [Pseudomonadota bacterium]
MNGLRLNEKIIIVTGAVGGLGQAMIEGLLMEGATILAVDQNEAKLQRIHDSYK